MGHSHVILAVMSRHDYLFYGEIPTRWHAKWKGRSTNMRLRFLALLCREGRHFSRAPDSAQLGSEIMSENDLIAALQASPSHGSTFFLNTP